MRRKRRVRRQVRVVKVGTPGGPPVRGIRPARTWLSKWELVLVVVVAALWLVPSLFPSLLPPAPPPALINISRGEYDSALAKWKSHNIKEYEISEEYRITNYGLDLSRGAYTLRVSDSGDEVEAISSTTNPYNESWTVEDMFEIVDDAFTAERDGHRLDSHGFYLRVIVEFHPEFGYPTYMELGSTTRGGEVVASWENTVTGFNMLKEGTPTRAKSHRPNRTVLDAYGWRHDLMNEQILERLLVLNLERASA